MSKVVEGKQKTLLPPLSLPLSPSLAIIVSLAPTFSLSVTFHSIPSLSVHPFLAIIVSLSLPSQSFPLPVSISSMFYEQLLRSQVPKVQKTCVKSSSFFALLGSGSVKAARRTLLKLTPNLLYSLSSVFSLLTSLLLEREHLHLRGHSCT